MNASPKPMWCAGKAAAYQIGIGYDTLLDWIKQGAPHRRRGRGYLVRVDDVQRWREETGRLNDTGGTSSAAQRIKRGQTGKTKTGKAPAPVDVGEDLSGLSDGDLARAYNEARMRKERAMAGKAELDEAAKRGELVPREEMRALVARMAGAVKSAALAIPGRLGKRVATMTTRDAELELEREMRGLLTAMAEAVSGL